MTPTRAEEPSRSVFRIFIGSPTLDESKTEKGTEDKAFSLQFILILEAIFSTLRNSAFVFRVCHSLHDLDM